MFSLPQPPPRCPWAAAVCAGATTKGCSHGVLSIPDSCWPRGQPAPAAAAFLSKAAGASSVLRFSEDQIQRKSGSNKLVQEVAT